MQILDKFRLDGKIALVTGASVGLGAAMAKVWPRPVQTLRVIAIT